MPSSAPLYGNYATQDTLIRQYSRSTECLFLFESMKLQRRQPMTVRRFRRQLELQELEEYERSSLNRLQHKYKIVYSLWVQAISYIYVRILIKTSHIYSSMHPCIANL